MNRWLTYPIILSLGSALWIIPSYYQEPAGVVLFSLALTLFAIFVVLEIAEFEKRS
jgi:hypothetical protein